MVELSLEETQLAQQDILLQSKSGPNISAALESTYLLQFPSLGNSQKRTAYTQPMDLPW